MREVNPLEYLYHQCKELLLLHVTWRSHEAVALQFDAQIFELLLLLAQPYSVTLSSESGHVSARKALRSKLPASLFL